MQKGRQRSSIFDGLKGIAILSVITYYYFGNWLPGGFLMVNLFFVVSGFLTIRKPTQLTANAYIGYVGNKVKRMWFPMAFMILLTAGYICLFQREFLFNLKGMGFSSLAFFNNYFQIISKQSYFVQSMNPSPFIHLWYLSMHMQFVLLVPFLHASFEKLQLSYRQQIGVFCSLIGLSVLWMAVGYGILQDPTYVYYDIFARIGAFLAGGLLLYINKGQLERDSTSREELVGLNLISLPLLYALYWMMRHWYGTLAFVYPWGMLLFTLLACVMILVGQTRYTFINLMLRFKPLVAVGRRSYALYLWFYPVHLLLPHYLQWAGGMSAWIQWLVIGLLAEITYRIVEQNKNPYQFGPTFNGRLILSRLDISRRYFLYYIGVFLLIGLGTFGLLSAQANQGKALAEIQEVIERNQAIVQHTETTATTEIVQDQGQTTTTMEAPVYHGPTFVGDSILLAIADQLREAYPGAPIEGEIGRQLFSSYDALRYLNSIGRVGDTVVTFLGTNGSFSADQLRQYMEVAGMDRTFYFVTVSVNKEWEKSVNEQLRQAAAAYDNVYLIDWKTQALEHPEWLYDDKIHPNQDGAAALVNMVRNLVPSE